MTRLATPVSSWIEALNRQVLLSRHAIVHGGVRDQAIFSGISTNPRSEPLIGQCEDVLREYVKGIGYELCLEFNPIDGLRIIDPSMNNAWEGAIQAAGVFTSASTMLNRAIPPEGSMEPTVNLIRLLMAQQAVQCVVVVHFVERLVGTSESLVGDERGVMIRLRQAMQDARYAGGQTERRNCIIGVAQQSSQIPGWMYQADPRIGLVEVCRPNAKERLACLAGRVQDFYGQGTASPDVRAALLDKVVACTDGLTLFEVDLLPRVSAALEIPLTETEELVRAARFGRKEDPWKEVASSAIGSAETALSQAVMGQPVAVQRVRAGLLQAHVGITSSPDRARGGPPKAVFFFVGPTGVGKTEMAKAIAELVFLDADRLKTINMADYGEPGSGTRLAGSAPGYVGHEAGGQLTNLILAEPFSVVLFDEIEKADKSVHDKFLGILEEGRMTDSRGMTAYFDQSILIFTSNQGSKTLTRLLEQARADGGVGCSDGLPTYEVVNAHYSDEIHRYFSETLGRPELRGRYGDNIIVFDLLRPALIEGLCGKFIRNLQASALRERGISLIVDQVSIVRHMNSLMNTPKNMEDGGRRVRELMRTLLDRPLNQYVFETGVSHGETVVARLTEGESKVEFARGPLS